MKPISNPTLVYIDKINYVIVQIENKTKNKTIYVYKTYLQNYK